MPSLQGKGRAVKIGFSGSRHGMTAPQRLLYAAMTDWLRITEFHYGDCKGADEAALAILMPTPDDGCAYHSHPATINEEWDQRWRAYTAKAYPGLGIIEHDPIHPIARNHAIVRTVDLLLATPATSKPVPHSGTWDAIKYARDIGVEVRAWGPKGEEI